MTDQPLPRAIPGLLVGMGLWWRGLRAWTRSGTLVVWGLVPGAVSLLLFGVVVSLVVANLDGLGDLVARGFVDERSPAFDAVSLVAAVAVAGAAAVIVVFTFTTVTLLIGQPAFERISGEVDRRAGPVPAAPEESWWRSTARGAAEGLRLILLSSLIAVAAFLVGLIPVAGTAAGFALGVLAGGWLLALELTATPLARRGVVRLRERRRVLGRHRAVAVGFGAMTFLVFLIPLGAVVTMPAAVSGATLLTRRLDGGHSSSVTTAS